MDRTVLLASFIFKDRIDWFIKYLETTFNMNSGGIFVYDIDDEYKVMITYKFTLNSEERINFRDVLPNATVIHKKGNAIYSINALNKLIELSNEEKIGNINYKSIKIDWENYQGKLLLIRNNNLTISPIKRIL